ncbi:MAG: hypothetical protein Q9184_002210 [Pyrenodesmia sp. 2 TL-2023]
MAESDPTPAPSSPAQHPPDSTQSYFSYPVSHVVSGLYRRLTEPNRVPSNNSHPPPSLDRHNGVYTPPHRTASPFQPLPLTPLLLNPAKASSSSVILTRALAEEIRLLVPPRLQLCESWNLVYSLEEDGVSLTTLYNKCQSCSTQKGGSFVLVVKDAAGGVSPPLPTLLHSFQQTYTLQGTANSIQIFGAYLTDAPHPSSSFYGTGECFLWRSSILPASSLLSSLPPPPSAPESASLGRSTTLASPRSSSQSHFHNHLSASASTTSLSSSSNNNNNNGRTPSPAPSVEQRIRFKAFPYSGVNDYLIFCETGFLSVGGGDGRYGLWLDGVLERGISSSCMTFGNEGLSEEGEKFEVVGVEVWLVGG